MLIKKDVFLRMIEVKCVELWRNKQIDAEEIYKDGVYGFFSKLKVNDAILSEDFSFCHRWVNDCSGEIWSKIDTYVGHQGVFKFTGRYFDKLKHNMI